MKQCDLCGAEMDAGSRDRAHDNPYRCLRELQARAERAEAEAAELRAELDAAHRKADNLALALEQSERQRREVSALADNAFERAAQRENALRANLDAARATLAGRAVDAEWPPRNVAVLARQTGRNLVSIVTRENDDTWRDDWGLSYRHEAYDWCWPLPNAPGDEEAQ